MLFKLCDTVRRLDIHSRDTLEFYLHNGDDIRLTLRSPTDEERGQGHESFNAFLDIFCELQIPKRTQPVFAALLDGRRPPEGQKANSATEMIHREGPSYGLNFYPDPFSSFIDLVQKKLSSAGNKIVRLLRWRYAQEGPPLPITRRGLFCSDDKGISWHPIPGQYSISVNTPPHSVLEIRKVDVSELSELAKSNLQEPIYHELLREAKELQLSSPRSSVIIAISALEIAVKSAILTKVPDAEWIIDTIQSPPVVNILTNYFPDLFPNKGTFYETNKGHGLIKTINDAVSIRNQMVHKGVPPPPGKKVKEILEAVQKLLWICDYYSGYDWAKSHIDAL